MAYDPNSPQRTHAGLTDIDQIRENFNQLRKFEAGETEPSNPVAGMFWLYTPGSGNWVMRQRNKDNSSWYNLWEIDPSTGNIVKISLGAIQGTTLIFPNSRMEDIADFPAYSGNAQKFLRVNSGEDGLEFVTVDTTPPDGSITQAKLKTSIGNVSKFNSSGTLTLPGGQYGFYPQIKISIKDTAYGARISDWDTGYGNTSYTTEIYLTVSGGRSVYARQRYITSSGEVFWIFLLRDKTSGNIISGYQAPDHPCFGNGADPILVPHPFGNYDPQKHEIIVINPTEDEIRQMKAECRSPNLGVPYKDLLELFQPEMDENGKIIADPLYGFHETEEREYPKKLITVGIVDDEDLAPVWQKLVTGEEVDVIKLDISKYQPDYVKVRPLKRIKK